MNLVRSPSLQKKFPLPKIFYSPREVVRERSLSAQQKRQILSDWISDRNAVESKPALRRHPVTGIVVTVDEILAALRELDRDDPKFPGGAALRPPPAAGADSLTQYRHGRYRRIITSRKRATGAGLRSMVSGIEKCPRSQTKRFSSGTPHESIRLSPLA